MRTPSPRRDVSVGEILATGVGERFLLATVDSVLNTVASWPVSGSGNHASRLQSYLRRLPQVLPAGDGLLLFGPNSSGKTYTVSAILIRAYELGYDVRFVAAPDIHRECLSQDRVTFERELESIDVLAIDDLGKEHRGESGYFEAKLDQILRARVRHCRPTLITTNLNPQKFTAIYQASVVEMLHEGIHPIEFPDLGLRYRLSSPLARRRLQNGPPGKT